MTVAPDVRRLPFEDLDGAVDALRGRGLRLSTSRRLVLQALFAAEEPVSAEEIARTLELELTSVYRNLETLERHGLVQHVHLGHRAGLYALVGRGEREYLYCERCGRARAVAPEALDAVRGLIQEQFGYQTRFTHFALVGICPECSARATLSASGPTLTASGHRHSAAAHPHPAGHKH
jgi:Fur family ferric uptake transcriptional regulator